MTDDFYQSYEWRRVRYEALTRSNGKCELCGRGPSDGISLNVDHIKPLRDNWDLRVDINNLQVLCNECNHGKGNRDTTDWRTPETKKARNTVSGGRLPNKSDEFLSKFASSPRERIAASRRLRKNRSKD